MKVKIPVTLSAGLLEAIDQQAGPRRNRSDSIEKAVRACIAQAVRDAQNAKDLEIINRRARRLNEEAVDVLSCQVVP